MAMVSIIIVTYNAGDTIIACIEAIRRQIYRDFEVIVVDNNSTDGSPSQVKTRFPEITLLEQDVNLGFAGGNLAGLSVAHGEYVAVVNPDACITPRWLSKMVTVMDEHPEVGICSSKLIYDREQTIESVGTLFTTAGSGYKKGECQETAAFPDPCEVQGACAAAAMYRRKMIEEIGFYDEEFFLNHEDTDLDFRALLGGWKSMYIPEAVAYHQGSATIGRMSSLQVYYFSRNSPLVWIKNMPFALMMRYLHHRLFYELFAFVFYCFYGRQWKAYFSGKFAAVRMMPGMLRKRRMIQANRRISDDSLRGMLEPLPRHLLKRMTSLITREP